MTLVALTAAPRAQQPPLTFPTRAVGVSSTALAQLFESYWRWELADSPERATELGIAGMDDRWRDWSVAARDAARVRRREFRDQLVYVGAGNLTLAEHLSVDVLDRVLKDALAADPWLVATDRLSAWSSGAVHREVFATIDMAPARSIDDYEHILARLRALPAYADQQLEQWRADLAAGRVQTIAAVDFVVAQLVAQRTTPAGASPLLTAFRQFPPNIGEADRARLTREANAAYAQQFVPAWARLESFLRESYRTKARLGTGLSDAPGGAAAYAALARWFSSSTAPPRELHQRATGEVERLSRLIGGEPPVADGQALVLGPDALAAATATVTEAEREAGALTALPLRTPVRVRAVSGALDSVTYSPASLDGSRNAWLNIATDVPLAAADREALVRRYGVPGVHVHASAARQLSDVPDFRRIVDVPAFSEGWSLYAAQLPPGGGNAASAPPLRRAQLTMALAAAVDMAVDTGVHALGWSRGQAIAYRQRYLREARPEDAVDRIMALPGRALAATSGERAIVALRERAQQRLGARFDLRAFHTALLANGALPLDLLEDEMVQWMGTVDARR